MQFQEIVITTVCAMSPVTIHAIGLRIVPLARQGEALPGMPVINVWQAVQVCPVVVRAAAAAAVCAGMNVPPAVRNSIVLCTATAGVSAHPVNQDFVY